MSNGIFSVSFKANTGAFGSGLVVVKDGKANGGDPHYLYQGDVPAQSGAFKSQFKISKWLDGNTNVVRIDNYTLNAAGTVNYEAGTIELKGSVVSAPHLTMEIMGIKISDTV